MPALDKFPELQDDTIPGRFICADGRLTLNRGRDAVILKVANTGDRPVQVLCIVFLDSTKSDTCFLWNLIGLLAILTEEFHFKGMFLNVLLGW